MAGLFSAASWVTPRLLPGHSFRPSEIKNSYDKTAKHGAQVPSSKINSPIFVGAKADTEASRDVSTTDFILLAEN
jgi:hypothetical protein